MIKLELFFVSGMLFATVALKVNLTGEVLQGNLAGQATITCQWQIENSENIEKVTLLNINSTQFISCLVRMPPDGTLCKFSDTLSQRNNKQIVENKLSITISMVDTSLFLCEIYYNNINISSEFLAVTVGKVSTTESPRPNYTDFTEPDNESRFTIPATNNGKVSTTESPRPNYTDFTVIIVSSVSGSVAALAAVVTFLVLCLRYKKLQQRTVNIERQTTQTA